MATVDLNSTKSPVIRIPPGFSDTVSLRVKEYSFGKSSSGRDQVTLSTEIIAPDKAIIDGQEYILAGQDGPSFYLGISDERVGNAKMSPLAALKEFHTKLGLPMELDTDNLPYEGLCFEYWLQAREKNMQKKEGNKWVPVIDQVTGKPKTMGWEWSNFLGNVMGPANPNM